MKTHPLVLWLARLLGTGEADSEAEAQQYENDYVLLTHEPPRVDPETEARDQAFFEASQHEETENGNSEDFEF